MWNKGKKHTDLTFIAVAYDGSGNMPISKLRIPSGVTIWKGTG